MTKSFRLIPLLTTVVGVAILCILGFWQLSRLHAKEELLYSIENSIKNEPIQFNAKTIVPMYSKVKLRGKFLDNKVYLYRYTPLASKKEGYYLLTPFKTVDGPTILIARGWLSKSQKASIDNIKDDANEEIIGFALQTEKSQWLVPLNDLKNYIWFALDLKSIGGFLKSQLENYYIFQIHSTNPVKDLRPLSASHLLTMRNNHMEYAITWFSLAFCLVGVYLFYVASLRKMIFSESKKHY